MIWTLISITLYVSVRHVNWILTLLCLCPRLGFMFIELWVSPIHLGSRLVTVFADRYHRIVKALWGATLSEGVDKWLCHVDILSPGELGIILWYRARFGFWDLISTFSHHLDWVWHIFFLDICVNYSLMDSHLLSLTNLSTCSFLMVAHCISVDRNGDVDLRWSRTRILTTSGCFMFIDWAIGELTNSNLQMENNFHAQWLSGVVI